MDKSVEWILEIGKDPLNPKWHQQTLLSVLCARRDRDECSRSPPSRYLLASVLQLYRPVPFAGTPLHRTSSRHGTTIWPVAVESSRLWAYRNTFGLQRSLPRQSV